jgi:glycosyltransferase involved in cell wall biosynthesis
MIEKVRDRVLLFWQTNKWVGLLQAVTAKFKGDTVVVYNKYHPIYTDFFLSKDVRDIKWVYVKNAWINEFPASLLLKMADAFHIDASGFHSKFQQAGKPLIVECEGIARGEYWENEAVSAVLFQSKFAGRFQLVEDNAQLLYPAIDANRKFLDLRKEDAITLLTVGHGGFIKGIDVSYVVYKELKKRGHKVRLVIAGSLGHNFDLYPEVTKEAYTSVGFEQLEREMAADPDVVIKPFRRRDLLNEIYPSTNVLLHFSRMETFGFTILEAISFGIPVVSVKFKAIPEMVEHGLNGFLCNPFNWDGMSQLDELCMNSTDWRNRCFEEGVDYVESIIHNKNLENSMRIAAIQKAKQFDFSERSDRLAKLYNCAR